MTATAINAALGVLVVLASAVFFFVGRRAGTAAERALQAQSKSTAEETAKRILGDAEQTADTLRKSAVVSGKEELIKLREAWEVEARRRREELRLL